METGPTERGWGKSFTRFLPVFWGVILLLWGCTPVAVRPDLHQTAVAVWDLDDLTAGENVRSDLGELLAASIIDILQAEGIRVVERDRLVRILEEQRLGSSGLADPATRLRLGRIAGAGLMLFGGYQVVGHRARCDLRLVDVDSGRIAVTAEKTIASSRPADLLRAVREVTRELVRNY